MTKNRVLCMIGLPLGLAIIAAAAFAVWPRPGLPPVVPADASGLEAELVALIDDHVAFVEANRSDPEAHARLGMVFEANAQFGEARASFANAVALSDTPPSLWTYHVALNTREMGDFDAALDILEELLGHDPTLAALHHRLGSWLLEDGQLEAAAAAFEVAMALAPSSPFPVVGLANVRLCEGNDALAASLLERAVEIDPEYRAAHYALGIAYRHLARSDDAARALRRGSNAQPAHMTDRISEQMRAYAVSPSARIAYGEQLIAAGQTSRAVALLEKALAVKPDHPDLTLQLASAHMSAARYTEALALLQGLESSGRPYVSISLARCCLQLGRSDEALAHADLAVAAGPTIAGSHLARASVLWTMGRHDQALASLEEAVRLDPYAPEIHVWLGRTAVALGHPDDARKHFQAAIDLAPGHLPAHLHLTTVCIERGELEDAVSALAVARRIAPRDPQVLALQLRLTRLGASGLTEE